MTGADWSDRAGFYGRRVRAGAVRWACTAVVLLASLGIGCKPWTKDNPNFCEKKGECAEGLECDTRDGGGTFTCIPQVGGADGATGGALGGASGAGGTGGSGGAGGARDGGVDSPDAPKSCPACAAPTPICDMTSATCVQCTGSSNCGGTTPICDIGTHTCMPCSNDDACRAASPLTPVCSLPGGACVVCTTKEHCNGTPATPYCSSPSGGTCVACNLDGECTAGPAPICNVATHSCMACSTDIQCKTRNERTPACIGDHCVECRDDSHCIEPGKPICVQTICKPCTTDAQCVAKAGANPGVCMSHVDGHCARDSEAIYVSPLPTPMCDDAPGALGTATTPFCTPQRAVAAATDARPVIILRKGMVGLERWTYGGALNLTIVGQGGAVISSGTGVGITITSGNVYLRNVSVTGMLDSGISVSGATTILRMDRCLVTRNVGGGLSINGAASYDIQNSVFADNNGTTTPKTFGGVYLNSPGGATSKFWNNTVYQNGAIGVACEGPYPLRGLLVTTNTISQVTLCVSDASSLVSGPTPIDPMFDPAKPYHLLAGSDCVDRGGATGTYTPPPFDIDGNPRPSGPASDCGAHEFQK